MMPQNAINQSRRRFCSDILRLWGGLALTGSPLNGCTNQQDSFPKQLNILNWADYLHPDAIPEFERRTGIKVVYDTFASNEALLAKISAGGTRYDIVVPSSYMVKQLIKLDLLYPLDADRLPGRKSLMDRFLHSTFDPGLAHCVPYTWGTTGMAYDKNARFASRPKSWQMFFDGSARHRMTLLDDAREAIGMAAKSLGFSYNTRDLGQLRQSVDRLIAHKADAMCFSSDQVITALASGDAHLSQVFSGDAYQAMRENKNIGYAIPIEGASIWTDNFCILATAPHKDAAYAWIQYMLEPAVAAACANYTRYAIANALALPLIESSLRDDPNLYPPDAVMARLEELAEIGSFVSVYDRLWTELKCA